MKKRGLCILLAVCMALTMAPAAYAAENTGGWYDGLIQSGAYRQYGAPPWEGATYGDYAYALLDIDQNGVPELLVRAYDQDQSSTAWPWYTVFTYDAAQGQAVFVSDLYPYGDVRYSSAERALVISPTRPNVYSYGLQFFGLSNGALETRFYVGCWSDGQGSNTYYQSQDMDGTAQQTVPESVYDAYLAGLTDIAFAPLSAYVPAAAQDAPSAWAAGEVQDARDDDLIPEPLDGKYQDNITRREFCQLAVQLLEVTVDHTIGEIMEYHDLTADENPFRDTDDPNVLAMYALRVVAGNGDGTFGPDQTITREQAAAMLTRLAKVLDGSLPGGAVLSFADQDAISPWAYYAVLFVSNVGDPAGRMVMSGTGGGRFSPKATYTREQAFLSFGRLYDAVRGCTVAGMRIEHDTYGQVTVSSRNHYLTTVAGAGKALWMAYDTQTSTGYRDEIVVYTAGGAVVPASAYEVWLRPMDSAALPVAVDGAILRTQGTGAVQATVQSAVSGTVWDSFPVYACDITSQYLLGDRVPESGRNQANFYTAGMYVDQYTVQDAGDSWHVTMDVYNTTALYGSADVYDAAGQYVTSYRIDKRQVLPESVADVAFDACGLIGDLASGDVLTYRQDSVSAHTPLDNITVPKGGTLIFTNNTTQSAGAAVYNFSDFFVEGISATVDSLSLSDAGSRQVAESFGDSLLQALQQTGRNFAAEEGWEILKWVDDNYQLTGDSQYMDDLVNGGVQAFAGYGIDVRGLFVECLRDVVGSQAAEMVQSAFEQAAGPAGAALKGMFYVTGLGNYAIQLDHYRQSAQTKSVHIVYPAAF